MGVSPALGRALTLDASHRWAFPLEFPLAAFFLFASGNLRSGSAAFRAGVTDPGYSGARSRRFDGYRNVRTARNWHLRFPSDMDFTWARRHLVAGSALVARF